MSFPHSLCSLTQSTSSVAHRAVWLCSAQGRGGAITSLRSGGDGQCPPASLEVASCISPPYNSPKRGVVRSGQPSPHTGGKPFLLPWMSNSPPVSPPPTNCLSPAYLGPSRHGSPSVCACAQAAAAREPRRCRQRSQATLPQDVLRVS